MHGWMPWPSLVFVWKFIWATFTRAPLLIQVTNIGFWGKTTLFLVIPPPVIYPNTRMDVSLPDLVSCRLLDYIFPACIKLYISYRCVQTSISRLSACTQSKLEILRFFLIFHLWFTLFLWFRTETINIFGVKMEIALCWVKLVAGGTLKIGWDCWSCVCLFVSFPLSPIYPILDWKDGWWPSRLPTPLQTPT